MAAEALAAAVSRPRKVGQLQSFSAHVQFVLVLHLAVRRCQRSLQPSGLKSGLGYSIKR